MTITKNSIVLFHKNACNLVRVGGLWNITYVAAYFSPFSSIELCRCNFQYTENNKKHLEIKIVEFDELSLALVLMENYKNISNYRGCIT